MKFLLIFVIFKFFVAIGGAPVNSLTRKNYKNNENVDFNAEKLISFMQTYGYLDNPTDMSEGLVAESLYAENAIIDGIKNVQRFGGLNPSGVMDDETLKLLAAPRCGVKDVLDSHERRKRYVIGSKNWEKRKITYFIANYSPKVNQTEMETSLTKAFDAWSMYSRLVFKRINETSADIIIAFGSYYHGDRYPFDGPGNILAHAYYPYEEHQFGGDIHFDNDENWRQGSPNMNEGVDFMSVAVHELGHSLGLAHSPVYNAIMFPYYKGATPAQLDYDDILGLYQLYIQRNLIDNTDDEDKTTSQPSSEDHSQSSELSTTTRPQTTTTTTTEQPSIVKEVEASNENHSDETQSPNEVPDFCEGHFDSMGIIGNQLYVIKSNYVWKFDANFRALDDFPQKISKIFPNLPRRFTKIDAFYENTEVGEIVMFSGSEYITYDPRGPIFMAYNLSRFTNDPDIERIDAAMVWAKNNKTYLFSESRFYRYSEYLKMDPFYPRVMKRWNGVPKNLKGAISFLPNGPTAFFKDDEFLLYDDKNVKPKDEKPRKISQLFDYCHDL